MDRVGALPQYFRRGNGDASIASLRYLNRNEISRWDGVFCPCHVGANHYSPNTPRRISFTHVRANHYSPNTPRRISFTHVRANHYSPNTPRRISFTHVRANHYSPNTPAHFIHPCTGESLFAHYPGPFHPPRRLQNAPPIPKESPGRYKRHEGYV